MNSIFVIVVVLFVSSASAQANGEIVRSCSQNTLQARCASASGDIGVCVSSEMNADVCRQNGVDEAECSTGAYCYVPSVPKCGNEVCETGFKCELLHPPCPPPPQNAGPDYCPPVPVCKRSQQPNCGQQFCDFANSYCDYSACGDQANPDGTPENPDGTMRPGEPNCEPVCRRRPTCGNQTCGPDERCVSRSECDENGVDPDGMAPPGADPNDPDGSVRCRITQTCVPRGVTCGSRTCSLGQQCRRYERPCPPPADGQPRMDECAPVYECFTPTDPDRCGANDIQCDAASQRCIDGRCVDIAPPTDCRGPGDCIVASTGEEGKCVLRDINADFETPDGVPVDPALGFSQWICVNRNVRQLCGNDECDDDEECHRYNPCDVLPLPAPEPQPEPQPEPEPAPGEPMDPNMRNGKRQVNPMRDPAMCPTVFQCRKRTNCGPLLCGPDQLCQASACQGQVDPADNPNPEGGANGEPGVMGLPPPCEHQYKCVDAPRPDRCTHAMQRCIIDDRDGYCIESDATDPQPQPEPNDPNDPDTRPGEPEMHDDAARPERRFVCYVPPPPTRTCGFGANRRQCAFNERCQKVCEDGNDGEPPRPNNGDDPTMAEFDADRCHAQCVPIYNCGGQTFCGDGEECAARRADECQGPDGERMGDDGECPLEYYCARTPCGGGCDDDERCSKRVRCYMFDAPHDEPREGNADAPADEPDANGDVEPAGGRCVEEEVCVPKPREKCDGPGACAREDGLVGTCRPIYEHGICGDEQCDRACRNNEPARRIGLRCCACEEDFEEQRDGEPRMGDEPADEANVAIAAWHCVVNDEPRLCDGDLCSADESCQVVDTECSLPPPEPRDEPHDDPERNGAGEPGQTGGPGDVQRCADEDDEACQNHGMTAVCRLRRRCVPHRKQNCYNSDVCWIGSRRGQCVARPQQCPDRPQGDDEQRPAGDFEQLCPVQFDCQPIAPRECDLGGDCALPDGTIGVCTKESYHACDLPQPEADDAGFFMDVADIDETACPKRERRMCRPRKRDLCTDTCRAAESCDVVLPTEIGLPADFGAAADDEGVRDVPDNNNNGDDEADEPSMADAEASADVEVEVARRSDDGYIAVCNCKPGYYGARCQHKRQGGSCGKQCSGDDCVLGRCYERLDNGVCFTEADGERRCVCTAGFTGEKCETRVTKTDKVLVIDVLWASNTPVATAGGVVRKLLADANVDVKVVATNRDGHVRVQATLAGGKLTDAQRSAIDAAVAQLEKRDDVVEAKSFQAEEPIVAAPSTGNPAARATVAVVALALSAFALLA